MSEITTAVRHHVALALVPGLGPKLTAALLDRFGSAEAARQASPAQLLEIPHIGEKLAASLATALRTVDVEAELHLMAQHGVHAIPLGFEGYPAPLATVPAPPPLLYMRGTWTFADVYGIAMVGSRSCTSYGLRITGQLARGLARAGFTIISGLARGIDAAAHRGALEAGGRTIAVLAGGLSRIYPPEHTPLADEIANGRGCLITESPMALAPQPGMFPARNRLISGLARAVIVVEAHAKSGALITATHAADQGREVYAVPGPIDSPASSGCLELIRNGARLIRSAQDVIEDLKGLAITEPPAVAPTPWMGAPEPTPAAEPANLPLPLPQLEPLQRQLFEALSSKRHADELARELNQPVGDVTRSLMQLELKKLVRRLPGNFYERR
jgi:DNA processing protein